jgi:uncharacterized membrane protein YkvA (DUF1232 family)
MFRAFVSLVGSPVRTTALVIRLLLHPRVPWKLKLLVPGALLYLLLPFDLFPDIIPFRGLVDDLLVLIVALTVFLGLASRYAGKMAQRRHGSGSTGRGSGPHVIEGSYRVIEDDQETPDRG